MELDYQQCVAERLSEVRRRISTAAARMGRKSEEITLVAVTKYAAADSPFIPALRALGLRDLGENRIPLLVEKEERYHSCSLKEPSGIRWHEIGSLQRNKVRKIIPFVYMIHSIDSERLLEAVDRIAAEPEVREQRAQLGLSVRVPVLLEVNIGGEESKHGFRPDGLEAEMPGLLRYQNVCISGFMAMGRLDGDEEEIRKEFRSMNKLSSRLRNYATEFHSLRELSMGMSGDFEWAIEQGATLVRIGSLLYPSR